ncbi:type IV secretion system protein [Pseudomonas sp. Marseille-Q5115]|uniref:type IV secretion system protein n=1 Tax=Pseudomonas sp. Marseille-Q5115 TaxID=2866593 RepID=UPI001CE3F88F|nr:type IV secretion system protein [Pseudomonas sp. Marseille-Q5115]
METIMKKKLLTLAICGGLAAAMPAISQAQLVVNDPVNLAQNVIQAQQLVQQLANLKEQLSTQQGMYGAMTGASGMGGLLPNSTSTYKENLPQDASTIYSDATNGNSSIANDASSMSSKFDDQIAGMDKTEALDFVQKQVKEKGAYDRVMTENAYNNQMRELDDIQTLTEQIDSTTSQKEISDLQARISTAQGAIQAEQTKVNLMSMMQSSQDKILEQQHDTAVERWMIGDVQDNTAPDVTNF